jgi:transcriptional regulator with XRE-family HTH domain
VKENEKTNPDDLYIGMRIRIARKEAGMTQSALAEHLELSFQQLQKYEKGTNRVSAARLFKIAKLLDVPHEYFFQDLLQVQPLKSVRAMPMADLSTPLIMAIAKHEPRLTSRFAKGLKNLVAAVASAGEPMASTA